MKVTPEMVKNYIQQGLDCEHIHVDGDGRHFEAVIVSKEFVGMGMLKQHQLVYKVLGDRMGPIHALSMKTLTPEQWANQA
jgi:acid stress-induced BolA-like protein IbaG/YrbA